jgi:hypothetical protein
MARYESPYLGLDIRGFWNAMERCFAQLLADPNPSRALEPDETLLPVITLDPPPQTWPDPADYTGEEEGAT